MNKRLNQLNDNYFFKYNIKKLMEKKIRIIFPDLLMNINKTYIDFLINNFLKTKQKTKNNVLPPCVQLFSSVFGVKEPVGNNVTSDEMTDDCSGQMISRCNVYQTTFGLCRNVLTKVVTDKVTSDEVTSDVMLGFEDDDFNFSNL